ncbi:hypothetical protein I4F81_010561 [Pyropia yezoensis]|uniref:Uncharacterized protein n=1 Tax=Pyropia yezoensis TaxID=2788 RepID=A0ACC3CCT5_PYRYE|nr:hypothetical protein I4F81_010561 [Neopyropia yezoensis]
MQSAQRRAGVDRTHRDARATATRKQTSSQEQLVVLVLLLSALDNRDEGSEVLFIVLHIVKHLFIFVRVRAAAVGRLRGRGGGSVNRCTRAPVALHADRPRRCHKLQLLGYLRAATNRRQVGRRAGSRCLRCRSRKHIRHQIRRRSRPRTRTHSTSGLRGARWPWPQHRGRGRGLAWPAKRKVRRLRLGRVRPARNWCDGGRGGYSVGGRGTARRCGGRSVSSSSGRRPRRLFFRAAGALDPAPVKVLTVVISTSRIPKAASTPDQGGSAPAIGGRHIGRRRFRSRRKAVRATAPGGRGGQSRTTAIAGRLHGRSRGRSRRSADRGGARGGRGCGSRRGGIRIAPIAGGLPGGSRRTRKRKRTVAAGTRRSPRDPCHVLGK